MCHCLQEVYFSFKKLQLQQKDGNFTHTRLKVARIKGMEFKKMLLDRIGDINQQLTLAKLCVMEVRGIAASHLSVFVILSISTHARCRRGAQREHGG